jgi:hypothetical protein
LSVEETAAMFGIMAKGSLKGESAGTLWRASLKKLLNLTPKASKTLRKYGIIMDKYLLQKGTEVKFKNYGNLLRDIFDKVPVSDFFKIFEDEGTQAMMAAKVGGVDFYETLIALNRKAVREELIMEMARRQMAGLVGTVESFRSAWNNLQITMFETGFADLLTSIIKKITKFIKYMGEMHPNISYAITLFLSLVTAMGLAKAAFVYLGPIIAAVFGGTAGVLIVGIAAAIAGLTVLITKTQFFQNLWKKVKELYLGREGEKPFTPRSERVYQPIYGSRFSAITMNGKIKIETDKETKVKEAEIGVDVPGNLGLNVAH